MKSIKQDMIDQGLSCLPILLPNGRCIEALYDAKTGAFRITRPKKEEQVSLQEVTKTDNTGGGFPYSLSDLTYWVIKRKDGITAKYVMVNGDITRSTPSTPMVRLPGTSTSTSAYKSLSDYCKHYPDEAIFSNKDKQIHIADYAGLKADWLKFDFVVDCGSVLVKSQFIEDPKMQGDPTLVALLEQYTIPDSQIHTRVLQLDWPDREAPPFHPQFFVDLESKLRGKVVVSCMGGHGRSGTTMVCLMMVMFKDYTPFTAMCHLRALHCPRAIEGQKQHEYIGEFGEFLGRGNDMNLIKNVKSFRESFLELKVKSAKPYQDQLRKGVK